MTSVAPHCVLDTDIKAFHTATADWLARLPIDNNVAATLIATRADGLVPTEPDGLWIRVLDGDELIGVALRTPPFELFLPTLPADAVTALVDFLDREGFDLPGVRGSAESADRFASRWSIRTGGTVTAHSRQRLFSITDVTHPTGVAGARRRATKADVGLILDWTDGFAADTGHDFGDRAEQEIQLRDRIADGRHPFWLWEDDGPTSMAVESPVLGGVARIQRVYTPKPLRGNGYASALVADLSADILGRDGVTGCVLYTDLSTPTSNHISQAIGDRPVLDSVAYRFRR